jgi:O-antigen ligase
VLGGLQLGVLTGAVLAAEKPLERVAIALLALVASAEIIVLYSRSAWIGALGIAALALVLNRRHRLVFMVTAAGAMVLAALVMFTNPTMRVLAGNLIGASAPPDAPSIEMAAPNDRIKIWSETLAMIRDVPLHGVGLGNFQAVFERQYNPLPNSDQRRGVHAHNLWLQRTAELGVVGGLWFAAMWAALLWAAWQSARRRATAVTLGVLLSLVGITLSNITDVVAGEVGGSRLCLLNWMLFGLAAGASQDERQS